MKVESFALDGSRFGYLRNSRNSETVFSRRNDEFWHSSKRTIRQSSSDSTLRILLDVSKVVVVVVIGV